MLKSGEVVYLQLPQQQLPQQQPVRTVGQATTGQTTPVKVSSKGYQSVMETWLVL